MELDKIELLIKELTEASGVSGYESAVRRILERRLGALGEVSRDKLGSIIGTLKGSAPAPRIMLAAHMDEVGFMVKLITREGFIKFVPLGGWPQQNLPCHRVRIETVSGPIIGVINTPPPYLLPPEERKKGFEQKEMFIDIGATSKSEVEAAGVRAGDPIVPVSDFTVLPVSQRTYMAKAFDDRIGCALLVAVMESLSKEEHPNTVFGVGTVQEEVGLRGANTSVEMVAPDLAIALDIGPIGDVPGIKPEVSETRLGGGPNLITYDARMIPNTKLRDLVIETAKGLNIALQMDVVEFGAYDSGIIHLFRTGVPSVVIAIPTRHPHSHNSILRRDDFDKTQLLVTALVKKLDISSVNALCD